MKKVIEIKNLSKKYLLYHETQGAYSTIVDSLSRTAKRWMKAIIHPEKKVPKERSFEEFWALEDVSLDFYEGDRIGILGKNGAGKSTLLKILSRIVEPSRGRLKIHGRVASLLEVGTGFHPELTGRENIFLNGAILGMDKREIRKKFDEIVFFSEVERFLDTPVKYYSSGMYARLGFAVAAHVEADILIVDEVLAVGDAQFQQKCLRKLNSVSQKGRTILFVSHNTAAILHLCNKGVLMEKGKVLISGGIEECVSEYVKTYRPHATFWEGNLGDSLFSINRAQLVSQEGGKDFFYTQETAFVEIDCEVKGDLGTAVIGFEVKDKRDHIIAQAHADQNLAHLELLKKPGKYRLRFELGVSYFWEGEYALSFVYFVPGKQRIIHNEIQLKFTVYRSKEGSFLDHGNREGVILPSSWRPLELVQAN